jgi:phosphonate transport system permease protein
MFGKRGMRLRRFIFNGIFYGYSMVTLGYLASLNIMAGVSTDWWEQNLAPVALGVFFVGLAGALFCEFLEKCGILTLGGLLFVRKIAAQKSSEPKFWKSFWGLHLVGTFVVTLIVSFIVTEVSFYELTDPQGFQGAVRLYNGLIHANLAILPTAILQVINTIFIAFLATALAIPVAFFLSFAAAKNLMTGPLGFSVYAMVRTFLNVTRSVEPLIWAVIFTVWVGVGPFAGMLALFIHSISSLAKQYSEIIEEANEGPIDGIRSTGANRVQTIWYGIVPQVMLQFIAYTIYRWDTNVRMATVIGLVGGGGIGTMLIRYQGQAMWPEVGTIIIVIAAVVWLMDTASAYLREALK